MKLNRIWPLAALALLVSAVPLFATVPAGYVQVTAARVQDSTGTTLANGTVVFCPVNGSGTPISYQLNGIGPVSEQCVSALVTSGAFSIQLADSSLTIPLNLCYNLTITDNVSGKLIIQPGYGCVQPSGFGTAVTGSLAWCTAGNLSGPGGTCDLDLYTPNLTALVEQQPGSVGPQGPPGPAGNCHWRGNWAASTAYAADDCYAESTNGYAVVTAYTSGSSFGSTDTANTVQIAVGCPISGCTFTGSVVLEGNPSANLQAAPKQYADAIVATETSRAETAEGTNAAAITAEITRAEGAETTLTAAAAAAQTTADAAQTTATAALPSAGALNAILPGTTEAGSGTSNHVDLPGKASFGGNTCPSGAPSGSVCFADFFVKPILIASLPSASAFSGLDPVIWVSDSADGTCTTGGGTQHVPCFSDGTSWISMNGGGGGGGGVNSATIGLMAFYAAGGSIVSGDANLYDDGTNINLTEPEVINDGTGLGGGDTAEFGTAPTASSSWSTRWADSTTHRLMMNNANTGALIFTGVASPATSGHYAQFASNGIDLADGGANGNMNVAYGGATGDSGAGSGPTITVTAGATDASGWISVTPGSSPASSAGVFTIVYGGTYATAPKCGLIPTNVAAGALMGTNAQVSITPGSSQTTAHFVAFVGSTALTASTAYTWYWTCQL